jgi:hypothetical protein
MPAYPCTTDSHVATDLALAQEEQQSLWATKRKRGPMKASASTASAVS